MISFYLMMFLVPFLIIGLAAFLANKEKGRQGG